MKKLLFFTILAFTAMNALAGQLGLDYIRGDKSPFHGYSYGLQIGCYF